MEIVCSEVHKYAMHTLSTCDQQQGISFSQNFVTIDIRMNKQRQSDGYAKMM